MTTPHIEHADLSEYVQMAIAAKEDMEIIERQAAIWREAGHGAMDDLEDRAGAAFEVVAQVLKELRRIAGETGDQT